MHPSSESVHVRLHTQLLRAIEDFRRSEADIPSRPEAVRRLVEQAVTARQDNPEGGSGLK
jgi:metal-responsive CopG/Arc/MetJ family transcriptional regulator